MENQMTITSKISNGIISLKIAMKRDEIGYEGEEGKINEKINLQFIEELYTIYLNYLGLVGVD